MAGILIYSDKDNLALELLTAANILKGSLSMGVKAVSINNAQQGEILAGAGAEVYQINSDGLAIADVAAVAAILKVAVDKLGIDMVLLSSDRRGKELVGRLAQKMGAGCLTDVSALKYDGNKIECQRNALGGATVAIQYIAAEKQVIAIMPKTFGKSTAGGAGKIDSLTIETNASIKVLDVISNSEDSVDIEAAGVLVAVGQGLNSKEDLAMIETLAKALGGEVGCSKPVATDKKWLSEERIIGLSGKKCKPELAVLLGISGQVQFNVGIRDAKTIVSVNSDEDATINQMADYILTADLHDIVPEMNKALA